MPEVKLMFVLSAQAFFCSLVFIGKKRFRLSNCLPKMFDLAPNEAF
jgi:hypothetical protein